MCPRKLLTKNSNRIWIERRFLSLIVNIDNKTKPREAEGTIYDFHYSTDTLKF